jgi:catalase-peroxidase
LIDATDIADLKAKILASGLSTQDLVLAAWASASSYRGSDKRGGANGARVRLAPQKDWAVNDPSSLAKVLKALEAIQAAFNASATSGKKVSLADLIVLGGTAAVERAAVAAGHPVAVPFTPGRMDASAEQTDAASFDPMEPVADGFRNWQKQSYRVTAEEMLVDRAQLLTLSAPEMTVLVGGMRALGANAGGSKQGLFSARIGALTPDFFTALLDMGTVWSPVDEASQAFEGRDAKTGAVKATASRVDLIFGSNSQLRALAEVYAQSDNAGKFAADFAAAWAKVMNLGRTDI